MPGTTSLAKNVLLAISAGVLLLAIAPASRAQKDKEKEDVAGQYECTEARVAGKVLTCTASPLSLKGDGKFELQGREGEYLVNGHWVELNGAVLKSRAKIEAGHKIVFRFHSKKGPCVLVFERRVAEMGKTNLG